MQIKKNQVNDTQVEITISSEGKELQSIKLHALTHFQGKVKVSGFREGKVPAQVLEKHVDPNALQRQFLDDAVSQLYSGAMQQLEVRPVDSPKIDIKKFVPYTSLEFTALVDVLGEVTLPDYKKITLTKNKAEVKTDEIKSVLESLQQQFAVKSDAARAAKDGDQVWIDFKGVEPESSKPIKGADGKDYPLILGSNTFIPGFEPQLAGLKSGEEKTFTITFPKDYGATMLAGKKVKFTVNITKVQQVEKPKLDDNLAKKAGEFTSMADLKKDIRKRLIDEKQHKLDRDYESELVKKISEKSKVSIPEVLINDQIERLLYDLRQNLTYRGQTMKEFLEGEGMSEEDYKNKVLKNDAKARVKAGLVLAEIADREKLLITPEELEVRLHLLRGQYQDKKMREELAKPEAKREVASRMLTEKTLSKLVSYSSKNK